MKKLILAVVFGTMALTVQGDSWFYEPTVDDFCTQLDHDLTGLPYHDRMQIMKLTKLLIRQHQSSSTGTINQDLAIQCTQSAVLTHVENTTFALTHDRSIASSMRDNVRAELKKTPYIDASVVTRYCGTLLEERIKKEQAYSHATPPRHHNSPPRAPRPHAPPFATTPRAIQEVHSNAVALTMQSLMGEIEEYLRESNMSESDRLKVKKMFWGNCQGSCFSEADFYRCAKRQVRDVVLENLAQQKAVIRAQLKTNEARQNLDLAIRGIDTRIQSALPDDSQKLNVQKIKNFCGTSLREEIIKNANLQCPVCWDMYKDQIKGGPAGVQVTIPCASRKHHVCSHCTEGLNKCPECREGFTADELRRNTQQAKMQSR